jgi:lipoprotein NlpD
MTYLSTYLKATLRLKGSGRPVLFAWPMLMSQLLGVVLSTLTLTSCAATYAPVVDKYGVESNRAQVTRGVHVVRPGETLYSISWRYGWDFKTLAAANRIAAPYTIYPGQNIRLDRGGANVSSTSRSSTAPSSPSAKPQPTSKPVSKPAPTVAAAPPKKTPPPSQSGPIKWHWPASGNVISQYSKTTVGQHGISIDGHAGDPVRAAANGVVVYRGDGLTGYGNLLIIKHSERWLSAYAHNQQMLVKEGQTVNAGERIATMGASGTFRTQLHFEVRRDGTPIDPMTVLPRK